ncbi:MAG: ABC transporter substrate-binding protein [Rhizobiales bacterium]|nr:ABC transporter substrate-binding protein [Hyphomicrobiales bacterium]
MTFFPWRPLSAICLALAMAMPSLAQAADKVTFRLEWRLSGYHLPFYWAQEKGYYAAEGLDVDIKEGVGSGKTISLIGGQQEDIGLGDYMLMAAAAAKGMKVKGVYAVVPNGAWAVVSYADNPIKKPEDMIGRSVAMTADHKAIFDLLLAANKIPADKVKVQVTSAATRNTVFVNGNVDAFLSVTVGSPLDLVVRAQQGKGKPIHFMPLEDFGVAPMGQGLVVHEQFIADKADVLRRFVRASAKGFAETVKPENLEEAVNISMKLSKASDERRESVRLQWVETLPRLHTRHSQGKPIGWVTDEDARDTLDVLVKTGTIEKAPPIASLFTNDFIPK